MLITLIGFVLCTSWIHFHLRKMKQILEETNCDVDLPPLREMICNDTPWAFFFVIITGVGLLGAWPLALPMYIAAISTAYLYLWVTGKKWSDL